MRLSNDRRTLNDFLKGFEQDNNINISLVEFAHFFELSFIDLDNLEFCSNYEIVMKNENIVKYGTFGVRENIDVSNFEIKVLSPTDNLASDEIYEYWNLEYELQEFINNRFFG